MVQVYAYIYIYVRTYRCKFNLMSYTQSMSMSAGMTGERDEHGEEGGTELMLEPVSGYACPLCMPMQVKTRSRYIHACMYI